MSRLLTTAGILLEGSLDPVPEPEDVNPGWIALIVVVGLIAVTVLLWFSLRQRLRNVHVQDDTSERDAADVRADDEQGGSNPA